MTYPRAPGATGRTVTDQIMSRPRQSHWSAVRTLSRIVDEVYGAASDFVYAWIEPDRPRLIEVSNSLQETLDLLAVSPSFFPALELEGLLSLRCEVGIVFTPRFHTNHDVGSMRPPVLRMAFSSGPCNRVEGVAWFSDLILEAPGIPSPPVDSLEGLLVAAKSIRRSSIAAS